MFKALSSNLKLNSKEAQEGEYKNDDGSILASRLRVELTKKEGEEMLIRN